MVKSLKPNKLGKKISSLDEAVDLVRNGVDVRAKTRSDARDIAIAADPLSRRPVHDGPHGPTRDGYRPHYHSFGRPKDYGHVFYSIIAAAIAPNVSSLSESSCTTNGQFAAAIVWDASGMLDPIGITDTINAGTGLDGGRGGLEGLLDHGIDQVDPLLPIGVLKNLY